MVIGAVSGLVHRSRTAAVRTERITEETVNEAFPTAMRRLEIAINAALSGGTRGYEVGVIIRQMLANDGRSETHCSRCALVSDRF
jgi:hypothetical protein